MGFPHGKILKRDGASSGLALWTLAGWHKVPKRNGVWIASRTVIIWIAGMRNTSKREMTYSKGDLQVLFHFGKIYFHELARMTSQPQTLYPGHQIFHYEVPSSPSYWIPR